MRHIVIFLGPPGVGKGTASQRIVQDFGFHWLSTGEMLRGAIDSGSSFGKRISGYIDAGRLVPDEMMTGLVRDEMEKLPPDAYLLLDGFPRTVPQAVALEDLLSADGLQRARVDLVVELQADEEELVRRIHGRAEAEGRSDDTPETVKHRLEVFRLRTAPLTDYYRQQEKLRVVSAMGTPEQVFQRVRACLQQLLEKLEESREGTA